MAQLKIGRLWGFFLWLLLAAVVVWLLHAFHRYMSLNFDGFGRSDAFFFAFLFPVGFLLVFLISSVSRNGATYGKYRVFEAMALAGLLLCAVYQTASHNRHVWAEISRMRGWPTFSPQNERDYICGLTSRSLRWEEAPEVELLLVFRVESEAETIRLLDTEFSEPRTRSVGVRVRKHDAYGEEARVLASWSGEWLFSQSGLPVEVDTSELAEALTRQLIDDGSTEIGRLLVDPEVSAQFAQRLNRLWMPYKEFQLYAVEHSGQEELLGTKTTRQADGTVDLEMVYADERPRGVFFVETIRNGPGVHGYAASMQTEPYLMPTAELGRQITSVVLWLGAIPLVALILAFHGRVRWRPWGWQYACSTGKSLAHVLLAPLTVFGLKVWTDPREPSCPSCLHPVTGLREARCSECGGGFSLGVLKPGALKPTVRNSLGIVSFLLAIVLFGVSMALFSTYWPKVLDAAGIRYSVMFFKSSENKHVRFGPNEVDQHDYLVIEKVGELVVGSKKGEGNVRILLCDENEVIAQWSGIAGIQGPPYGYLIDADAAVASLREQVSFDEHSPAARLLHDDDDAAFLAQIIRYDAADPAVGNLDGKRRSLDLFGSWSPSPQVKGNGPYVRYLGDTDLWNLPRILLPVAIFAVFFLLSVNLLQSHRGRMRFVPGLSDDEAAVLPPPVAGAAATGSLPANSTHELVPDVPDSARKPIWNYATWFLLLCVIIGSIEALLFVDQALFQVASMFVSLLLLSAILLGVVSWTFRRKTRDGDCPTCQHSLAGLKEPICPECGGDWRHGTPPPSYIAQESRRLAEATALVAVWFFIGSSVFMGFVSAAVMVMNMNDPSSFLPPMSQANITLDSVVNSKDGPRQSVRCICVFKAYEGEDPIFDITFELLSMPDGGDSMSANGSSGALANGARGNPVVDATWRDKQVRLDSELVPSSLDAEAITTAFAEQLDGTSPVGIARYLSTSEGRQEFERAVSELWSAEGSFGRRFKKYVSTNGSGSGSSSGGGSRRSKIWEQQSISDHLFRSSDSSYSITRKQSLPFSPSESSSFLLGGIFFVVFFSATIAFIYRWYGRMGAGPWLRPCFVFRKSAPQVLP